MHLKLLGFILLLSYSLSSAQDYTLSINGQVLTQTAITVDGRIYVPLEALTQAGVAATLSQSALSLSLPGSAVAGGANQRESLEGCLGQDLFNGIWRMKVLSVEPIADDTSSGWGVTIEMRNGTTETLQPVFTGISGTGEGIQLVLSDGTILNPNGIDVQAVTFASLPQGGGVTHQLKFWFPYGAETEGTPDRLLFEIKPGEVAPSLQQAGVVYSTPTPSLRVRLACNED